VKRNAQNKESLLGMMEDIFLKDSLIFPQLLSDILELRFC